MQLDKYTYHFDQRSGLTLREDEDFELHMNPILYLEDNFDRMDPSELRQILIHQVQNELHSLLDAYLSGPFLTLLTVRVPIRQQIRHRLASLRWYITRLVHLGGTPDAGELLEVLSRTLSNKLLTSSEIARSISKAYIFFAALIENEAGVKQQEARVQTLREYSEDNYQSDFLRPVVQLKKYVAKHLAGHLLGFYVHGSLSTLDYCAYSDFDTLMIIKSSTLEHPQKLESFQRLAFASTRFLHMLDPLQHHGHFVLTELDLDYFPETYFPPVLFDYSTSLIEDTNDWKLHLRDCSREKYSTIWSLCYNSRSTYLLKTFPRSRYRLKSYLSQFMLLPATYLQWKGMACYKKYSFDQTRHYFNSEDWSVMDEAGVIRDEWGSLIKGSTMHRKLLTIGFNPALLSMTTRTVLGRVPNRLKARVSESFYKRAAVLAERMNDQLMEHQIVKS